MGGVTPLLIRYTKNFDSKYETKFWYCIFDRVYNIDNLPRKRRYEIRKSRENFIVKKIMPLSISRELYNIFIAAQKSYPKKNQRTISYVEFEAELKKLYELYGDSFYVTYYKGEVPAGYLIYYIKDNYGELITLKQLPEYEKYFVNYSLIDYVLKESNYYLKSCNFFVTDGSRNVNHDTHFQSFLEQKFGFRKAYCNLIIIYNKKIKWIVKILYAFRKILKKLDNFKFFHLINSVLKMEELSKG